MYGNLFLRFLWNNIFQIILLMHFNHFFLLGIVCFQVTVSVFSNAHIRFWKRYVDIHDFLKFSSFFAALSWSHWKLLTYISFHSINIYESIFKTKLSIRFREKYQSASYVRSLGILAVLKRLRRNTKCMCYEREDGFSTHDKTFFSSYLESAVTHAWSAFLW